MRLAVNLDEFNILQLSLGKYLEIFDDDKSKKEVKELLDKLDKQFKQSLVIKTTKRNATRKATEVKKQRVKDKIINAVNLANLEAKNINVNLIAKISGCSYNTVKKYKYLLVNI